MQIILVSIGTSVNRQLITTWSCGAGRRLTHGSAAQEETFTLFSCSESRKTKTSLLKSSITEVMSTEQSTLNPAERNQHVKVEVTISDCSFTHPHTACFILLE